MPSENSFDCATCVSIGVPVCVCVWGQIGSTLLHTLLSNTFDIFINEIRRTAWSGSPCHVLFLCTTECDLSAASSLSPLISLFSLPLALMGRTLLNKLGVKKCAHFKRFNRFAAARFDLCRQTQTPSSRWCPGYCGAGSYLTWSTVAAVERGGKGCQILTVY